MKKKAARSSSTKKKMVKKSTKRSVATSSHGHWTKPRLHKEQMEFYDQHPNARNLIMIFLIVTGVFVLTYIMTMM